MHFTTTVKLVLEESPNSPLTNVQVSLFERDRLTPDDRLGSGRTDERGEARIQYTSEDFTDLDERLGSATPELYAVVYDTAEKVVVTTRADAGENLAHKLMRIAIPRALAERHQLIPSLTAPLGK